MKDLCYHGQPENLKAIVFHKSGLDKLMTTVAKVIELNASSSKSIEDAVETGIRRADSTLDNVEGA